MNTFPARAMNHGAGREASATGGFSTVPLTVRNGYPPLWFLSRSYVLTNETVAPAANEALPVRMG